MKTKLLGLALIAVLTLSFQSQSDELFEGEEKLQQCRQHIPMTGKKKDKAVVSQKAKELYNKELVLVQYEDGVDKFRFNRYYLVTSRESRTSDKMVNFLVPAVDYADFKKGRTKAVFFRYEEDKHRFYMAKCFDEVVTANPEIIKDWDDRGKHYERNK